MATIINAVTGEAVKGCFATVHNSASSYGMPVWSDAEGNAYMQVGLQNPLHSVDLDDDALRMSLGEQIRNRRMSLGLTQKDLSKATGIAVANISKLERGGPANTETICKIASAMGMRLALV